MKANQLKNFGLGLCLGLYAPLIGSASAWAELVFEDQQSVTGPELVSPSEPPSGRVEDRGESRAVMREALRASQKAQVTRDDSQTMVAQAMPQQPVETQNYTRSEILRRERQREELKNEDLLQQRLEELRLRDERRRTGDVLGQKDESSDSAASASSSPLSRQMGGAPQEQVVVIPAVEQSGKSPVAQLQTPASGLATSSIASVVVPESGNSDAVSVSVSPKVGLSGFMGQAGYFDVRPRYSVGVGVELDASEHVSFGVDYIYNEFGVAMASSNPWAIYRQRMSGNFGGTPFETLAMKQNLVDASLKLYMLSRDSKIRPFISAGAAYSKSYMNFDSRILSDMAAAYGTNISPDYEVSGFLGSLGTGLEVRIGRHVSVGAQFKYYTVLSARENTQFSNYYNAFYPGMSGAGAVGNDTMIAGGSLARSSFYSILGNVAFSF